MSEIYRGDADEYELLIRVRIEDDTPARDIIRAEIDAQVAAHDALNGERHKHDGYDADRLEWLEHCVAKRLSREPSCHQLRVLESFVGTDSAPAFYGELRNKWPGLLTAEDSHE